MFGATKTGGQPILEKVSNESLSQEETLTKDTNKKGKEKKEKKKEPDKIFGGLTPVFGPLPSPLCRLPPLRRLNASGPDPLSGNAPALPGSLSRSQGLELFKSTTLVGDNITKTSSSSMEEERKRLLTEREERVHLLQEELRREEEEVTKRLKEQSEATLKRLRITLEKEKLAEYVRLNAQKKQDMEHLEAELKEQLEAERTRLQGQNEEKLNALKKKETELQDQAGQLELRAKELKDEENMLQTKIADLNRRKTKMGEEEQELDRQIELIQQRDPLREELERLTEEKHQAHELIQRATEERSEAKEEEEQLMEERDQLRGEPTKMREEKCQAWELIQRAREERSEAREEKEQLREERDQLMEELERMREGREQLREELERMREEKHEAQELIRRVREEMNKATEEGEKRLREEIKKARDESRRAKDKEKLESRVRLLQERCEHLRHRVSELEQGEGGPSLRQEPKQDKKREEKTKATTPPSDRNDAVLYLDDSLPLSPLPDIQSNMDKLPCYISSRPTSIRKPIVFVERESGQLKERPTALWATQSSISLDFNVVTEEMIKDLLQEVRNVSQLEQKVRRVKEDQIRQLKSVRTQEPLVTDDVPESDLSCTLEPVVRTAPAKVLESLQQISDHFNTVLSTLASVAQRPHGGATPYTAFPVSTNQPHFMSSFNPHMHQTHSHGSGSKPPLLSTRLPEPSLNWATQRSCAAPALCSVSVSSGLKACDDLINRQWSHTFPGAAMNPVTSNSMTSTSAYSSYTPSSKYSNSLCSVEMDGQSLQRRIDSMKTWLEMRKKDTSIPLLTRYQITSSEKDLT